MWRFSLFGSSRKRAQAKELEKQVTALQTALSACKGMAHRWTLARRGVSVGLAFAMLVLGFVLGTYRESLQQAAADLGNRTVIARSVPSTEAAYAAYRKNDYTDALKLARPLAEQGDARAQALLGLVYSTTSRGIPRDDLEAAKWFRLAAGQGDASAQFNLGVMHAEGHGVTQDFGEAVRWYQMAADQGYPQAQFNLGLWYATDEAAFDRVLAHKWLNLAAGRFPASDTRGRNAAVQNRDLVAAKMTPEQLAEAQRLTRDWRPKERLASRE
jgi:TPR repeat protein